MRSVLIIVGVAVLTGCPPQTIEKLPPAGQFYFPTGIVHLDAPNAVDGGAAEGILYVASSDFDRRYDFSSVIAVDLSKVGLPPFNAPVGFNDGGFGVPLQLTDLKLTPGSTALIAPFAGELAALAPLVPGGPHRLFVPTRSELNRLYGIDATLPTSFAQSPTLQCFTPAMGTAPAVTADGGADCTPTGLSLTAFDKTESGIPRAPAPIGVAISKSREVWVTSLQQADTPKMSTLDTRGYVVRVNGDNPILTEDGDGGVPGSGGFVNIGAGGSYSVVVGNRFAYVTGRVYASSVPSNLVRAIDTTAPWSTINTFLENTFTVFEGRGLALSSDESRMYLLGRSPDSLLVASVDSTGPTPNIRIERSVPLPEAPNQIITIPRPGKSDLVMITCSTAGVVVFYDDEVGNLTGQITGVGLQPYAIAVDLRVGGARAYVTNFTDGRVTVIDVPDLSRPASAKIVAFLGGSQLCITRGVNEQTSCDGGSR